MRKDYNDMPQEEKQRLVDAFTEEFIHEAKKQSSLMGVSFIKSPESIAVFKKHLSRPAGLEYIELHNAGKNLVQAVEDYKDDPLALRFLEVTARIQNVNATLTEVGDTPVNGDVFVRKLQAADNSISSMKEMSPAELDFIRYVNGGKTDAIRAANHAYHGVREEGRRGFGNSR